MLLLQWEHRKTISIFQGVFLLAVRAQEATYTNFPRRFSSRRKNTGRLCQFPKKWKTMNSLKNKTFLSNLSYRQNSQLVFWNFHLYGTSFWNKLDMKEISALSVRAQKPTLIFQGDVALAVRAQKDYINFSRSFSSCSKSAGSYLHQFSKEIFLS